MRMLRVRVRGGAEESVVGDVGLQGVAFVGPGPFGGEGFDGAELDGWGV